MKRLALLLAALAAVILASTALADSPLPRPVGYVNDFAGVIPADVQGPFEDALRLFEQETTVEVVVVTVKDLGGTTVEDYAVRLFSDWGVGKKGVDNGVLILLAVKERGIRIEVGYGMEPYLTDGKVGRILDNEVLPDLRQDNYSLGLLKGARAVAQTIKDSGFEPGSVRARPPVEKIPLPFQGGAKSWVLLALAAASLYAVSFMARSKSFWFGGIWGAGAGGLVGWLLGIPIWMTVGAAMGMGALGLGLDAVLSSAYVYQKKSGGSTRWHQSWGGFSGGGRGGWGGGKGFGGFGGGRSGGGGASRRF